jgi:hypothetical protein
MARVGGHHCLGEGERDLKEQDTSMIRLDNRCLLLSTTLWKRVTNTSNRKAQNPSCDM